MIGKLIVNLFIGIISSTSLLAQERGTASYYSNKMHGRRMSNGQRYHRDSLTCAHKRYPLGSYVKVTNIRNKKWVVVKVTDRCGGRRIIDLSHAAAKEIGLLAAGVATVLVERLYPQKGVPFKKANDTDLPELDYEVTEGDDYTHPAWQKQQQSAKKRKENSKKK